MAGQESVEPEKRGRGRPKKTEMQRVVERAIAVYDSVKGTDDPALRFLPEEIFSDSRTLIADRVTMNRLLSAKRLGLADAKAAEVAGISRVILYKWKLDGEQELERRQSGQAPDESKNIYVCFLAAYMDATHAPLQQALSLVDEHIRDYKDVKVAQWLIERINPDQFSPTRRVHISEDNKEITVNHIMSLPERQLDEIVRRGDEGRRIDHLLEDGDTIDGDIIDEEPN